MIRVWAIIFCLWATTAHGLTVGEISYQYEASLDSQYVIGIMPKVVLHDNPGVKICGQWYRGDQIANAPNVDIPMGIYCRITDENGSTFFKMRDRFNTQYPINTWNVNLVDLSQRDIRFKITSPVTQTIPVGY